MKKSFIIGIILLIGIVAIAGCTTDEPAMDEEELKADAVEVTANELYVGEIAEGTTVRIQGYVIDIDNGLMRIVQEETDDWGFTTLDYGNDILIEGRFGADFYENEEVIIHGIYTGPESYQTAIGGRRTVPRIGSAIVESTGERYTW